MSVGSGKSETLGAASDQNTAGRSSTLLPDFLVIGGMKCATTTLHQDLSRHSGIFCGQKELNVLTRVTEKEILDAYIWNLRASDESDLLGDVSTQYSKHQQHPDVAQKARSMIGPDLKIVYIVREPIARAISHHQHMMNVEGPGRMVPDINVAIEQDISPIHFSQYADQLKPWIETFGIDNIRVVKFEDYVSDRQAELEKLFQFLEVANEVIDIDVDGANRGGSRMTGGRFVTEMIRTKTFQGRIKPLLPTSLMPFLRRLFLRKAKLAVIAPTEETINFIFESVRQDVVQLQEILGLQEPLWDMEKARQKHIQERCGNQNG